MAGLTSAGMRRLPPAVVLVLALACSPGEAAPIPTNSQVTTQPTISIPQTGMEAGERLPGERLWALVPDNDIEADRINLVFAAWGWDDTREFLSLVTGALSWDGNAYLIDDAGRITDKDDDALDAALGLFAIEPWRSFRRAFNVWYTDIEPETPVSWLNTADQPFSIEDVVIVTVAVDAERYSSDLTSVAGQDGTFVGPGVPERPVSGNSFAHAVVLVDSVFPAEGLVDVAHELGHAMFNLPDEYVGDRIGFDGREDLSNWPSCAEDTTEADNWWGDLKGKIDPMLTVWTEEMAEAGFPLASAEQLEEIVVVGAVDGGCYGVPGSARATFDSLMNSSIPVLGSVNRRWAVQILALWDGSDRPERD